MPKVLAINKTAHDYSAAEQFGKLVFLTSGSISRFATNNIFRGIEEIIQNSGPDDYLLIGGHSVLCGIACGMFAAKHKRLNLLIFRARRGQSGKYEERVLKFN